MLVRFPTWVTDLAITVFVALAATGPAIRDHAWSALPFCAVTIVAVWFRRRHPVAVLVSITATTAVVLLIGGNWLLAGMFFALLTVARYEDRRTALRLGIPAAALLVVPLLYDGHWNTARLVGPLVIFAVAWLIGDNVRAREHEREEKIELATAEERARIARELHDVVTHNVSVMVVQAAAAGEIFEQDPQRAREAIGAVEETGRRALNELRRLLGTVAGDEAGVQPQPGLDRLGELVDRVRAAGLEVELIEEGAPGDMPEGVGLSAYRIVQESLTNTLKHAFASHVTVRVSHSGGAVEVEVTDDGVGSALHGEGRGLIGMRERVALYGGELDAGSRAGGGYGVRARIPVTAA